MNRPNPKSRRPVGGKGRPSASKQAAQGKLPAPRGGRAKPSTPNGSPAFRIVERDTPPVPVPDELGPFRVVIAVHRPRFRGRSERAAAIQGWDVTALLNKQDPVGLCAKPPRPPDLLILSGDFGRQKDLAIFRAVQKYRQMGMRLVGLVDDCATPPEGFPDSVPSKLCDLCLSPPYKAAELRAHLGRLYEEMTGEPMPPPLSKSGASDDEDDEE